MCVHAHVCACMCVWYFGTVTHHFLSSAGNLPDIWNSIPVENQACEFFVVGFFCVFYLFCFGVVGFFCCCCCCFGGQGAFWGNPTGGGVLVNKTVRNNFEKLCEFIRVLERVFKTSCPELTIETVAVFRVGYGILWNSKHKHSVSCITYPSLRCISHSGIFSGKMTKISQGEKIQWGQQGIPKKRDKNQTVMDVLYTIHLICFGYLLMISVCPQNTFFLFCTYISVRDPFQRKSLDKGLIYCIMSKEQGAPRWFWSVVGSPLRACCLVDLCLVFQNEPFFKIKERIQKRIDVPDKEFEKVCEILPLAKSFEFGLCFAFGSCSELAR